MRSYGGWALAMADLKPHGRRASSIFLETRAEPIEQRVFLERSLVKTSRWHVRQSINADAESAAQTFKVRSRIIVSVLQWFRPETGLGQDTVRIEYSAAHRDVNGCLAFVSTGAPHMLAVPARAGG